jgi:UDP-N-acetylmuramoylalanine--D-glutamate ligase
MNKKNVETPYDLVIGFGVTGQSITEFLIKRGRKIAVLNEQPDKQKENDNTRWNNHPQVDFYNHTWPQNLIDDAHDIYVSPGVPIYTPPWSTRLSKHHALSNDLTLFEQITTKPILAVTGSNGKSTVVSMLEHISKSLGYRPHLAGNIGKPMLDLWRHHDSDADYDHHIIELSSFQLATCPKFKTHTALVNNIWPNHLDWHTSMDYYTACKLSLYQHTQHAIVPHQIDAFKPKFGKNTKYYKSNKGDERRAGFHLRPHAVGCDIMYNNEYLISNSDLTVPGEHGAMNAMHALMMGHTMGWSLKTMTQALRSFTPLPHRIQSLGMHHDLYWINDSKATNSAAVKASLNAMKHKENLWLMIGGQRKNQDDFDCLLKENTVPLKGVICFGHDREYLFKAASPYYSTHQIDSLSTAINYIKDIADKNDTILFSPGCASYDAFKSYIKRGEAFMHEVTHEPV